MRAPHRRPARALARGAALAFAVALAAAPVAPAGAATTLSVVQVATGLTRPVFVASPPGDPRLFIVEQRGADAKGRIKIVKNGVLLAKPFLTTGVLAAGNEQGLLGLAFAPDFATSGTFYVNYTQGNVGDTKIVRHHVSLANPDVADSLGETILTVTQPYTNHNAGWMAFGPDGYLWFGLGDGGDAGDPQDRAQDRSTLLGKMLRIDVSGPTGYTVPPDNPFVGVPGARPEIWSIGLRNPYRCSFDRETHDFVIGDVGQTAWEEVDFAPYPALGKGANYGWRCWEGNHSFATSSTTPCTSCTQTSCFVFPAWEYDHSLGRCSVTGGYVYRGCAIPDLCGTYFFADYCGTQIYTGRFVGGALTGVTDRNAELAAGTGYTLNTIVSFGEDAAGELYFCDLGGQVYKVVPRTGVAEADMPALRVGIAGGDSLGATSPGNALLPGITAFADAGGRIAGVGFLKNATLRGCATTTATCLAAPLRLGTWDIDVEACVDVDSARLTRRFVFTNRAGTPQALAFRDVIAPWLDGTDDLAGTYEPAAGDSSGLIALYDAVAPTRYLRHRGSARGATITQDVGTKAAITTKVAADQPLAGALSAGPGQLAIAFGFDFGTVAPAAAETVTVVTRVTPSAPVGVEPPVVTLRGVRLRAAGAMPFRGALTFTFELPVAGDVGLAVYDGRGRLVRRLLSGTLSAGQRTLEWDGRDDRGADVAAGLYFLRATTPSGDATLRAVRVR